MDPNKKGDFSLCLLFGGDSDFCITKDKKTWKPYNRIFFIISKNYSKEGYKSGRGDDLFSVGIKWDNSIEIANRYNSHDDRDITDNIKKIIKRIERDYGELRKISLEEIIDGSYSYKNGKLYVDGNVILKNRELDKIPFSFHYVSGSFNCGDNQLISLKGSPDSVGSFYCNNNKLTNLIGCSKIVRNHFTCINSNLKSLEGSPKEINGDFLCNYNNLVSLKGSPEKIGKVFDCSNNELVSLRHCPKEVGSVFNCSDNNLVSLKYLPKENEKKVISFGNPFVEKKELF
jgi:hypothetical protein